MVDPDWSNRSDDGDRFTSIHYALNKECGNPNKGITVAFFASYEKAEKLNGGNK